MLFAIRYYYYITVNGFNADYDITRYYNIVYRSVELFQNQTAG